MHLEDLIEHISESYPNIWALTGLHFNNDANYQLASYFKSRYTIDYQHGSNSFGGVCLAIAREVPHRITSEFNHINNLIATDVFNSNKKYTVAVVYSPPSEEVPLKGGSPNPPKSTFDTAIWKSVFFTSDLRFVRCLTRECSSHDCF